MNTIEVRKITPPNLKYTNLGRKILCHRPVRIGSPNMSVEFKDGKIIAHNYGHGGSGWTLGPGSASYVNDLLVKFKDIPDLKKNTLITIIGAGVLGFFTAYDLLERGFTNITIIAKNLMSLLLHTMQVDYSLQCLWIMIQNFRKSLTKLGSMLTSSILISHKKNINISKEVQKFFLLTLKLVKILA